MILKHDWWLWQRTGQLILKLQCDWSSSNVSVSQLFNCCLTLATICSFSGTVLSLFHLRLLTVTFIQKPLRLKGAICKTWPELTLSTKWRETMVLTSMYWFSVYANCTSFLSFQCNKGKYVLTIQKNTTIHLLNSSFSLFYWTNMSFIALLTRH